MPPADDLRLPSLDALRAFEAAARLGSFERAADEPLDQQRAEHQAHAIVGEDEVGGERLPQTLTPRHRSRVEHELPPERLVGEQDRRDHRHEEQGEGPAAEPGKPRQQGVVSHREAV